MPQFLSKFCSWFSVCSFEKDAPDTSDEQDVQERSDRAAFAQELLISALFLD